MQDWLLLHYTLPSKPSALRVKIWRKLKSTGAIFWQDAVWVLPDRPRTRESLQWIAVEIRELGGDSTLWKSTFALPGKDDALVEVFRRQVDLSCAALLTALSSPDPDLGLLSRDYLQLRQKDYFNSPLCEEVHARFMTLRKDDP